MDEDPGDLKLKLTSLCNRTGIPAGDRPQPVYLLTQLLPHLAAPQRRLPLNVAVILDRSSPAMAEGLPVFKQALKDLVDQLHSADYFSLISLSGPVILTAQPVKEKTWLKRQIDKITLDEEALRAAGIAEGLNQALAYRSDACISRIIIILAGEVAAKSGELESLADQAGWSGTQFSVVGFGNRWDEGLWIDLADRSSQAPPGSLNGMLAYAPSPDEVAEVMQRVYRSLQVLGRDVCITLRFIRGVTLRQAWRVAPAIHCLETPQSQEQAIILRAAELSQEGAAFLVEAILPPRAEGQARIAQTEVIYRSNANTEIRQSVDLVVVFSQDMGGTNPLDRYVMNFVEMAQAHRLNMAAMADVDDGNRQTAIQKFRQAAAILVSQGHIGLADRIRGEADYNVRQHGQISSEARKMILLTGRSVTLPEGD